MDRALVLPALVLLDEVGAGTDPIEGGALGVAVVDHFRRRGATVMATSHYDALKSVRLDDRRRDLGRVRVRPGDVRADLRACIYGTPGRSLALEIAARLGLNPEVVAAARGEPEHARGAAGRAPGQDGPGHAVRSSTSGIAAAQERETARSGGGRECASARTRLRQREERLRRG